MEFTVISLLNGLSYGLLLFMLSSGLTLIFSMMGVLNFAHASFYMMGAYLGFAISKTVGFWPALVIAPLLVGLAGAAVERIGLRAVHKHGHVSELLFTFGLSYVMVELVQLIWGRAAVPYPIPAELDGPLFTLYALEFPMYRAFMMAVALLMLVAIWLLLTRTRIGLVIQAALTHPETVEALGHNVPRVFMLVFEPAMAATVGSIIFVVVVVGGMGSLAGALLASILIGMIQTFAVALDWSVLTALTKVGLSVSPEFPVYRLLSLTLAEVAPILPYMLLVLMLIFRPKGLLGTRES